MKPIKALLVEDNDGDVRLVKEVVAEAEGGKVELSHVYRLQEALNRLSKETFDVVLLDLSLPDSQGLHTFDQTLQAAARAPILVLTGLDDQAMAISTLQRGAQDYLVKGQFDGNRLMQTIRFAVARHEAQVAQFQNGSDIRTDNVYGFIGAKGGCGSTTVACHLAAALRIETGEKTLLADLDLISGSVEFLTGAKSNYSALDAADTNIDELDSDLWAKLVFKDESDLEILTAPPPLSCKRLPKPERLGRVLRFARSYYDRSIVDLGSGLTDFSLALLYDVDLTFIVTTPDVLALSRTTRMIEALTAKTYPLERLRLIVNRMPNRSQLSLKQIEEVLRLPAYAVFTDSPGDLADSYTKGTLASRNSALGAQFTRFANKVAGIEEPVNKRRKFFNFG